MKVIAGSARSIDLLTLPGEDTRPTTARNKETLFNIIQFDVQECSFLDLFSGSGAIGIEALSRGAKEAYFVDNNPKAISYIKTNLAKTKLNNKGKVMEADGVSAIKQFDVYDKQFDIIFIDPPYNKGLERSVLEAITESNIIHDESIIIIEVSSKTNLDYLENIYLQVYREKAYKTSKHVFINKI